MSTETKPTTPPPPPAKELMKTCTCRCVIDKGWDVPMSGVTPAEALVLTSEHAKAANGKVITDIKEGPGVDRTIGDEIARLKGKYGAFKINALFPGAIPQVPKTYEEALKVGQQTTMPQSGLGSFVHKK